MTLSKTPKVLILFAILALAGAVVVAGCGGSSSSESTTSEEAAPPAEETEEEPPAEEEETGGAEAEGGEAALTAEGKTVFTSNCGSCHTLSAAGTSGTTGPNLDELEPSDSTVEHQVINGGGPMPAFGKEEILTPTEIKAASAYVSSVAGE
ncbi:MAG TPA: cytochrome c [Solirubrobacterales bacterium]|jgi:mono/diheme cytochrome c family protein|nr:cytochrome c [Solirubrobacterales bacterium]